MSVSLLLLRDGYWFRSTTIPTFSIPLGVYANLTLLTMAAGFHYCTQVVGYRHCRECVRFVLVRPRSWEFPPRNWPAVFLCFMFIRVVASALDSSLDATTLLAYDRHFCDRLRPQSSPNWAPKRGQKRVWFRDSMSRPVFRPPGAQIHPPSGTGVPLRSVLDDRIFCAPAGASYLSMRRKSNNLERLSWHCPWSVPGCPGRWETSFPQCQVRCGCVHPQRNCLTDPVVALLSSYYLQPLLASFLAASSTVNRARLGCGESAHRFLPLSRVAGPRSPTI